MILQNIESHKKTILNGNFKMQEIPKNVKIAIILLCWVLISIFVSSFFINKVFADEVLLSNTYPSRTTDPFGSPVYYSTDYVVQTIDCADVNGYVTGIRVFVNPNGNSSGNFVVGFAGATTSSTWAPTLTYISTSTSFFATPIECKEDTGIVELRLYGSSTPTNVIYYPYGTFEDSYAGGSLIDGAGTSLDLAFEIYGISFDTEVSTSTICDMSSTTEAVYAVGYSINIYMGIFLALLFGTLAFMFFKKFIT